MNNPLKYRDSLSSIPEQNDGDAYLKLSFTRRVVFCMVIVIAGMLSLFARLFYLQVNRHEYYSTRSELNRIRIKPLVPERGTICDARGVALTENILRYQVTVNPSHVDNVHDLLGKIETILPLSAEEKAQFIEQFQASRRYENVVLKASLNEGEYYRLSAHLYQFAGVEIEPYYERYYPYGELTAHVIGYTNRISEEDLADINPDDYRGIRLIGRLGIERQYEERLRGKSGYQQVETDANNNLVRVLSEVPAQRGEDIYLSLDVGLQKFIYDILGDYRGACVVINPENGSVLAMVSKPGFDSNLFTQGISQRHYQRLLEDPHGPLYDRALKGAYPPGSVIKPLMLLAGLHYQIVQPSTRIYCSGHYTIANSKKRFHCWKRSGHGSLTGRQAIAHSCDVYFYSLGAQMGIDRMYEYLRHFAIGRLTGIDLPNEASGIMPNRQWKQNLYQSNWYIGDTVNVSIGQGFMTTTPLQLAYMTTLIARKGKTFVPHLLRRVYDPVTMSFIAMNQPPASVMDIYNENQWHIVERALEDVVHGRGGTASKIAQGLQYRMAAKSGTVQVISFKNNKRIPSKQLAKEHQDNAMFIAYAPVKAPKMAISLVVERGGGGSSVAAPMVREICDFYLNQKEQTTL